MRERPIQKELNRNFGITSMIRAAGYAPSVRDSSVVGRHGRRRARRTARPRRRGSRLAIERVRLADERPVVFSIDSFRQLPRLRRRGPRRRLAGEEQSLYSLLHKLRGIVIYRGEAELVPCKATAELRALLEVKSGAPLLCMKQVDFDQHGRAVVYSVEYHVADWVRFSVERLGPGIATIRHVSRPSCSAPSVESTLIR